MPPSLATWPTVAEVRVRCRRHGQIGSNPPCGGAATGPASGTYPHVRTTLVWTCPGTTAADNPAPRTTLGEPSGRRRPGTLDDACTASRNADIAGRPADPGARPGPSPPVGYVVAGTQSESEVACLGRVLGDPRMTGAAHAPAEVRIQPCCLPVRPTEQFVYVCRPDPALDRCATVRLAFAVSAEDFLAHLRPGRHVGLPLLRHWSDPCPWLPFRTGRRRLPFHRRAPQRCLAGDRAGTLHPVVPGKRPAMLNPTRS